MNSQGAFYPGFNGLLPLLYCFFVGSSMSDASWQFRNRYEIRLVFIAPLNVYGVV